jgi:hypothetical protein
VLGEGATSGAGGWEGVALGHNAQAIDGWQVALGANAVGGSRYGIAVGYGANGGSGYQGMALGQGAQASQRGIAIGTQTVASHTGSTALGTNIDVSKVATTTASNQIMLGTADHTVTSPGTLDFTRFSPAMITALKTALGIT